MLGIRDVYADTPDAARDAGFWIRVFANLLDPLALAAISQAAWYGRELWIMFSVGPPFIGSVSAGVGLLAVGCLGLGYFWIAIDPRRQGWHDKLVRTLVVHRA